MSRVHNKNNIMKQSLVAFLLIVINVYGTLALEKRDKNYKIENTLECYESFYLNETKPKKSSFATVITCDPGTEFRCFTVDFKYSLGKNSRFGVERGCMPLNIGLSMSWSKWMFHELLENKLYPTHMKFEVCNRSLCNYTSSASTLGTYCTYGCFLSAAVMAKLYFKMT